MRYRASNPHFWPNPGPHPCCWIGYINNNNFYFFSFQQINNTDDDGLLMNIIIEGMICDAGSYMLCRIIPQVPYHSCFWTRIISKPLNKICIPCGVWSIVQHVKIWSDYIRWLDYYHGSKILVWNLMVWYHSSLVIQF